MSPATRSHITSVLLLLLLGCSGDPTGPGGGTLSVTIQGLPSGAAAAVSVSGPAGYSQSLTGSQTFTGLAPGVYSVTASDVTVGAAPYQASPPSQTVTVVQSGSPGLVSITYTTLTGSLALTISGLGTSTAAVTVTGPGGYSHAVGGTTNLTGLNPGAYTVAARDTTATGGTMHTASPSSQPVTITAQMTANANVTYTPPPSNGSVNLHVAGMYLTQSAQDYAGGVPLVKSRNGYLRVFVVADRANAAAPTVRVRYYNGMIAVDSATILPSGATTPTAVDESSLGFSWNVPVPGTLIQPGLSIQAQVNPAGTVAETDLTDNTYPAAGPLLMDVRTVPTVNVTFVPVLQLGIPAGRRIRGNVTNANKDQFLQTTQKMHPIASYNAVVHADFTTTTTDTLQDLNGNGAWGTILGEIDAQRLVEHSPRYFYGVARVSYNSGVAGVAYVSNQSVGALAALGWDHLPSGGIVAAHELGHNWGRSHAPCGGPSGIDPSYPHTDGSTGSWGLDVATQTLEPASLSDIMGYCDPKWISDYTYRGVLNYLISPSPPQLSVASSQAVQPCLLVWGHIRNGELVLEPAFEVTTKPSLPVRPGPYSLEARGDDGSSLFDLSFAPLEVADAQQSQQNFAFAVPLTAAKAARLRSLRLTGQGRQAVAQAPVSAQPDSVQVRRVPGGLMTLRWNAAAHPMVMVRDPATGEVLSFARGGNVELSTSKSEVDLIVSDGVNSRMKRVRVVR